MKWKFVRDKVPELMEQQGLSILSIKAEEIGPLLRVKLVEEAKEVAFADGQAELVEELADAWTVLKTLAKFYDIEFADVKARAEDKESKYGGFSNGCMVAKLDE